MLPDARRRERQMGAEILDRRLAAAPQIVEDFLSCRLHPHSPTAYNNYSNTPSVSNCSIDAGAFGPRLARDRSRVGVPNLYS